MKPNVSPRGFGGETVDFGEAHQKIKEIWPSKLSSTGFDRYPKNPLTKWLPAQTFDWSIFFHPVFNGSTVMRCFLSFS